MPHISSVQQARDQLTQYERNRRDERRRRQFWQAHTWQTYLQQVITAEQERDQAFQQHIDELHLNSSRLPVIDEQFYNAIEEDITWYQERGRELERLRMSWSLGAIGTSADISEVVFHEYLIWKRYHERCVHLAQFAIERQERIRRRYGYLQQDTWFHYWQDVRTVWSEQDQFFERAYPSRLPEDASRDEQAEYEQSLTYVQKQVATAHGKRLDWCQVIREYQTTTQSRHQYDFFDASGYQSDVAQVDQAIAELAPSEELRSPSDGGGAGCIGMLVVAAIIAVFISFATAAQQSPVSPATAPTLNAQGMEHLRAGNCSAAVPLFEQAIATDPAFYEPYNNAAFCLYDQGQLDTAIDYWQRAIERYPNSADAHAGLGMALYTSGQHETGLNSYRRALELEDHYWDENWLRENRFWSQQAINDSRPLRVAIGL